MKRIATAGRYTDVCYTSFAQETLIQEAEAVKQKIKASEQDLKAVFGDGYLFRIPLYQRPYAWTAEQVDELLDDLVNALGQDAQAPYFLGSIVLIKDESNPHSEVVDGQQRLTTLAMILCVLRDLADDENHKANIDVFIRQQGNELKATQDQFRLSLRKRDRAFFDDHVQTKEATVQLLNIDTAAFTDTQRGVITNVKRIHQQLVEFSEDKRWSLAKFIAQQCFLVVVTATDSDSAYRIFSVMNDRGLDLSPTDILKAETIGRLAEADQIAYGSKWETVEERHGRDDFRDLFAHVRMIYVKAKLRRTLQADFREQVLSKTTGTEFIDQVLEPYSDAYETVRDASYKSIQDAEEVNRYLRFLGRLNYFDWIPPAMAFFHQKAADHEQLARFTKDLERLSYGLFIVRDNINQRITRYAEVLRAVERRDDLFRSRSPLQLRDYEKTNILQRLNGPIYWETPIVRRVLLERLDSLLADLGATYAHQTISVEHVLPQNPRSDSEWMAWFPIAEERQDWTHRLANLVLLSRRKNSQASNWDFERKKREYFQRKGVSTFALTTQVLAEAEWTPKVLERRQQQLIGALNREWRLD